MTGLGPSASKTPDKDRMDSHGRLNATNNLRVWNRTFTAMPESYDGRAGKQSRLKASGYAVVGHGSIESIIYCVLDFLNRLEVIDCGRLSPVKKPLLDCAHCTSRR